MWEEDSGVWRKRYSRDFLWCPFLIASAKHTADIEGKSTKDERTYHLFLYCGGDLSAAWKKKVGSKKKGKTFDHHQAFSSCCLSIFPSSFLAFGGHWSVGKGEI